jgi:nicotinate-nucleotide adenylyltransferase
VSRLHLLFGGTFDPVHLGHLQIARAVAQRFGAPVHLVPAADPPHRAGPGASAGQRAQMLDIAVSGDPLLCVDRRELRRREPSYTVDTLAEVRAELGQAACIVWVLGIDSVLQLDHWHHWKRLLALANLLGVQRPHTRVGREWLAAHAPEVQAELAPRWTSPERLARQAAGAYAALALRPLRRESATEVRARIATGRPWRQLLAPGVPAFIESAGLYGASAGAAGIIAARQPPSIEGTR